jgi:hypothetical protein
MSGAVPPLAQYAFMAWCSAKAQGQLYLYLLVERGTTGANNVTNATATQRTKTCVFRQYGIIFMAISLG